MVAGLAVIGLAALRVSALLDRPASPAGDPAPKPDCLTQACRANGDESPVRGYEAPSVAVDPNDPNHIVVTDINLVGGRCGWHVTFDGGKEWEDGVFELPTGFRHCQLDSGGFLPAGNVAMGPSGNVYAALTSAGGWDAGRASEGESILLAVSGDGGRTFDPARIAATGPSTRMNYLRPSMTVTAGPSGTDRILLSFWVCDGQRCTVARFSQSTDGGETFSPPATVNDDIGANSPSQPALGSDGSVHVLYLRRYNDQMADLVLATSADGETFSTRALDRQPQIGLQYDSAKLVADPRTGALYTVFTDTRSGTSNIYFRRSLDNGATWRELLLSRSFRASFSPALSLSHDGRIDVTFYQRVARDKDSVHWTFSADGGSRFARDIQLNEGSIGRTLGYWNEVGDWYTPSVSSTAAGASIVWSDTQHATPLTDTQDTFLRRIEFEGGSPRRG